MDELIIQVKVGLHLTAPKPFGQFKRLDEYPLHINNGEIPLGISHI